MLAAFIQDLSAMGRACFSFEDIEKLKGSSPLAIKAALRRLRKKGIKGAKMESRWRAFVNTEVETDL